MDVYRQAAEVIRAVREGHGTAKALCLRKEMQKKRQTYAVVCETLRHYDLLEDVLAMAEFFTYFPQANREFALCMTYDVVLGKGVHTNNDSTARAVTQSAAYLREAYWRVRKHHVIAPRETAADDAAAIARGLPRYARVNTLKIAVDDLVGRLRSAAASHKRERAEDAATGRRGSGRALPPFTCDAVVPQLLVFPPGTDLHAHPAVRGGQLVLQDRASCLPACVLLDAVPVVLPFAAAVDVAPLEYVLDACAAPGNKTTQLAALGAPRIKIMAIERDERRAGLLQRRVQSLGAADYVNVVHRDFFDLAADDRAAAEAILLDPSCSASGVVTRVDVRLACDAAAGDDADGDERDGDDRVTKLARLQRKLLAHALLSFDHCRTVVYSTCSIHEAENEGVVREVLQDARVQARGWGLSDIMPELWHTRGRRGGEDDLPLHRAIRCDPATDATSGFFVARFDRRLPQG